MAIDASFFECFGVCLWITAKSTAASAAACARFDFAAPIADKHDFDLFLEGGYIGYFVGGNAAATKYADVRKCVEMRQSDIVCLQPAHRKTGHRPMFLIGDSSIVGINEWNQFVNQNVLKCTEVESAPTAGTAPGAAC